MNPVDDYLRKLPASQKAELERVRSIVKQLVPEAEEMISYGMPTLKYKGAYLIYFAAYKNHMSIFGGVPAIEDKLEGFTVSHKGTLQFTEAKPVPKPIIQELVHNRLLEIERK